LTRYRISHRAAADLRDIGRFTQARGGRSARIEYLRRIAMAFDQLAANPSMGRPRPEISNRIRTFPVGRHLVIYRDEGKGLMVVIRVVHQAMDYSTNPCGDEGHHNREREEYRRE
jgi:toxin ParE1/3/4